MTTPTVKQAQVKVNVDKYIFVHGKAPRGNGCWYFAFDASTDEEGIFVYGSYTQAKATAVGKAARLGCRYITVGA